MHYRNNAQYRKL